LDTKSDKQLVVETLKNGEKFSFLMKKYEKKLLYYIKRLSNISQEDAEDLLQEIFIKTYENLNDYNPKYQFSTWIYRITYNHVISHFRKTKARPQLLSSEDNLILVEKIASDFNIPKDLDKKYTEKAIKRLLKKLDKKYRDVLILKFLEEKDYKQIAYILKRPMGTVATLLNRAKKKFKEILEANNITDFTS